MIWALVPGWVKRVFFAAVAALGALFVVFRAGKHRAGAEMRDRDARGAARVTEEGKKITEAFDENVGELTDAELDKRLQQLRRKQNP